MQPRTSVYSVFCAVNAATAHAEKQRTGLYKGFSSYLPHSTATDTNATPGAVQASADRLL